MSDEDKDKIQKENIDKARKIFDEHGNFIQGVLKLNISNDVVDDLFQDLFLDLVRKPIPDHINNVQGYLYRAIVADCCDARLKLKRYKDRLKRSSLARKDLITSSVPVDNSIVTDKTKEILNIVDNQLRPCEATAVKLKFEGDLSNTEIAQEMGIEVNSATKYIHLGLKKVRNIMSV